MTVERIATEVEAQHEFETRLRLEADLLRILLRDARGEWVGFHDAAKLRHIVKRYPDLAVHCEKSSFAKKWISSKTL